LTFTFIETSAAYTTRNTHGSISNHTLLVRNRSKETFCNLHVKMGFGELL